MPYTALEEMQICNMKRLSKNPGPAQPANCADLENCGIQSAVLGFIRDGCTGLRFGDRSVSWEINSGVLKGKSTASGQIPYNMEMDIDRLCLERSLCHFLDSGREEDAYCVYYCYLEMFFGGGGNDCPMAELLPEYETEDGSVITEYSHKVYVLALGLAFYSSDTVFREEYRKTYGYASESAAAAEFLKYWGLTSLFHDDGCPDDLKCKTVETAEPDNDSGNRFKKLCETVITVEKQRVSHAETAQPGEKQRIRCASAGTLEIPECLDALSSYLAIEKTLENNGVDKKYADCLCAVALNKSSREHTALSGGRDEEKCTVLTENRPMTYVLSLCDGLLHGENTAGAENPARALLDTFSTDRMKFETEILNTGYGRAEIHPDTPKIRVSHLYDYAVALNGYYTGQEYEENRDACKAKFESMSLEYRLSNIRKAKEFRRYLREVRCRYYGSPEGQTECTGFTQIQMNKIAELEHARWVDERWEMGWRYSDSYGDDTALKEQTRCSKWMPANKPGPDVLKKHFDSLPETEKAKDAEPFSIMFDLVKKYDGLGICSDEEFT